MGHPEHGHRRIADRSGAEKRHQVVGVLARTDGHAVGQHGGRPGDPAAHGGQPRRSRPTVLYTSATLAVATRSRDIGRRTAAAQDCDCLVQVRFTLFVSMLHM